MNAATGAPIADLAHLRQSIAKILTTPVGTRVMRRDFGSILPDLIDQPVNPATRLRVMAATATAIIKWEKRVKVTSVVLCLDGPGLIVDLSCIARDGGERFSMTLPLK